MKKIKYLGVSLLAFSLLVGCSNENKVETPATVAADAHVNKQEKTNAETTAETLMQDELTSIKKVVEDNLASAESEDLESYLNTMSKEIKENPENKTEVENLFKNFDIDYELLKYEVVEKQKDKVVVKIKQKVVATKVAEGNNFVNHIVEVKNTFVKEADGWKFSASETLQDTLEVLN